MPVNIEEKNPLKQGLKHQVVDKLLDDEID